MPSFRERRRISHVAVIAASAVAALLSASPSFASQGPGGGLGTATSFTQTAMAIIVWGTSAVVIAAGLIGAARQRH